jgi:hypothetical protein
MVSLVLGNPKIQQCVHKIHHQTQFLQVHTIGSLFFKIHFNIMFQSAPSKWSPALKVSDKILCVYFLGVSYLQE